MRVQRGSRVALKREWRVSRIPVGARGTVLNVSLRGDLDTEAEVHFDGWAGTEWCNVALSLRPLDAIEQIAELAR